VLVGARTPLVAYNAELGTDDVEVARSIAASVRESNGGMRGVQAIGLKLPAADRVQVSMNILDLTHAPLHEVVGRVRDEARVRGTEVVGGELVGLVPASVLHAASEAGTVIHGIDESRVLEDVLSSRLAEWPGRPS
jgi:glutamate formiminotransferase